jgi:hypothetical protein
LEAKFNAHAGGRSLPVFDPTTTNGDAREELVAKHRPLHLAWAQGMLVVERCTPFGWS